MDCDLTGGSTAMSDQKILIVDDDPIVADSLADFLGREGYATATACAP